MYDRKKDDGLPQVKKFVKDIPFVVGVKVNYKGEVYAIVGNYYDRKGWHYDLAKTLDATAKPLRVRHDEIGSESPTMNISIHVDGIIGAENQQPSIGEALYLVSVPNRKMTGEEIEAIADEKIKTQFGFSPVDYYYCVFRTRD